MYQYIILITIQWFSQVNWLEIVHNYLIVICG